MLWYEDIHLIWIFSYYKPNREAAEIAHGYDTRIALICTGMTLEWLPWQPNKVWTLPYMVATESPTVIAFNTLRPRQNGRHFADDIFKCIFLNENIWIPIKISLKFVPKGSINNIPALVQIMAWRRLGDKPLSEPMMVRLPTHICVTRPQWVR